jgi:hypothetical protein
MGSYRGQRQAVQDAADGGGVGGGGGGLTGNVNLPAGATLNGVPIATV